MTFEAINIVDKNQMRQAGYLLSEYFGSYSNEQMSILIA